MDATSIGEQLIAAVAEAIGPDAAADLLLIGGSGDQTLMIMDGIAMLNDAGVDLPDGAVEALMVILDDEV